MSIGTLLQDLPRRLSSSLGLGRPVLKTHDELQRKHSPLPYDVLQLVMDELETPDLLRVKLVNRTFYSAASSRHRHALRLAEVPTTRGGGMPPAGMELEAITHILKREVALGNRLSGGVCATSTWWPLAGAQRAASAGNGRFVVTWASVSSARKLVRDKLECVPGFSRAQLTATAGVPRPLAFAKAGMKPKDIVVVNKLLSYQRGVEGLRDAGSSRVVELWDLAGTRPRTLKLDRHRQVYSHVSVAPDGRYALVADASGIVSALTFGEGTGRHTAIQAPVPVLELLVTNKAQGYAFVLSDGIYAGSLRGHGLMQRIANSPAIDTVRISREGAVVAYRQNNAHRFGVWSLENEAQQIATFTLTDPSFRLHTYITGAHGQLALFNCHRSLLSVKLDALAGDLESVAPQPLSRLFGRDAVSANAGGYAIAQIRSACVAVTDLARATLVTHRLVDPDARYTSQTTLSPDASRLAVANNGWLSLANVGGSAAKELLPQRKYLADAVAFSPDGAFLATAATGQVHVWRFVDGVIEGRRQAVSTQAEATSVEVSDDSQVVTATFADGTVARCDFAPRPEPMRR